MTTPLDIISRSLRLLGVYPAGEALSPEEAQDGLYALNTLLQSMSNDSLFIYARSKDESTWTAGTISKTFGPTGDVTTTRPMKVLDESFITWNGVDYPLNKITLDQYNSIPIKTIQGIPRNFYVQTDMPNVTVYVYPVPQQTMTMTVWSEKLITSFSGLTGTISLPPGYERALAYMLAVDIAPEYQVEPSATVVRIASASKSKLKRENAEIPQMDMPYGVPNHPSFIPIQLL